MPKTIKDMPEHTRPREKLRERGASALTDEELVAAILGMGTAGIDVRTMAKQVAGLIREHREGLTLDHLLSVPGMSLRVATDQKRSATKATESARIPELQAIIFKRPAGPAQTKRAMKYNLKIKGLDSPDGTISIRALKELVDLVLDCSERGLRLAVQGESVKRGAIPAWLARSLDFTVTGLEKGSTTLVFDVPLLGDTASKQIKQQDLWYSKPKPEDTALTLLSRSVKEAVSENLESNAYDKGVLDGLLSFESFFKTFGDKLVVQAHGRPAESFSLSCSELEHVRRLKTDTPEPTAFVISGQFDLIQHSSRRFHLLLSNGQVIPGTIERDILNVENMREFWGKKVTIEGMVHFNPGRKVRLLEAQTIKAAEEGEEIFEKMPSAPKPIALFETDLHKLSVGPALEEIWGKWPGDEPIEELLSLLTP